VAGASSPQPQPITGPQLADVQATPEGLSIRTAGGAPATVQVQRSRNRREVYVILEGIALSDKLQNYVLELNRYGISKLQLNQLAGTSPSARLTLFVDPAAPNWQASVDPSGGIALVPAGGMASIAGANAPRNSFSLLGNLAIPVPPGGNPNPNLPVVRNPRNPGFPSPPNNPPLNTPPPNNPPPRTPPPPQDSGRITTISGIDLGGDQLLIRADRPINFISRMERGGRLRIFIRDAQFSPSFQQPRLAVGSPIVQVQYRQENDRMISILFTPADGVRIQGSQLFSGNAILVQLQRRDRPSDSGPVAVPFPTPTPEPDPTEGQSRPRRSDGRTVVVIDPGHGGRDPGAIGIGGIRETDIVMDISLEVARVLQQQGVIVRLTRSSEVEVDLAPRVSLAERSDADVFVSIHANAINMSRPDINGIETFSGPGRPRSARLAASIHNSVLSSINMQSRGLKQARFYVLTRTSMPSALVETGFVTGSNDAPNLASPAWRRRMAQAIARGIVQYLRSAGQL
jgi:N-acetylmuramoyl-L-alanine amidase